MSGVGELLMIAPARTAVIFYRAEFTFPLVVAHAISTISYLAQRQCGYHYGASVAVLSIVERVGVHVDVVEDNAVR